MDLEEYIESLRKEKARELFDIEIEEITLCKSPANRKKFFITKRSQTMKDFDKAIDLAEEFLDEDIEKVEKVDGKKLKKAIETILAYKEDTPDELKDAIDTILKCAVSHGGRAKKSQIDDWPSIPIMAPAGTIDKMVGEDEEEDEDGIS